MGKTEEEKLETLSGIVSTAALLHDITHIPFGHTLEDEFSEYYLKHDAIESPRLYYLLFSPKSNIARIFAQAEPLLPPLDNDTLLKLICLIIKFKEDIGRTPFKDFAQLLTEAADRLEQTPLLPNERELVANHISQLKGDYIRFKSERLFHPFMSDVISNTVCADLLDYIARDTHYTGLQSRYDIRILQYFIIARDSLTESLRLALLVIDRKGGQKSDITTEVLNLMRMRYSLAERVYYHKAKVGPSAMLARALSTPLRLPDGDPYGDSGSILDPRISDDELIRRIEECERVTDGSRGNAEGQIGAQEVREIGRMLRLRQIYKPCVILPKSVADRVGSAAKYITMFRESDEAVHRRRELEARLSQITGKGRHSVIIYCPPMKMQAKEIETRIQLARDQIVPLGQHLFFAEEVRQLNLKYQALWKLFVFVHPECFQNEAVISRVIAAFCAAVGIPEDCAKEVSPYGYLSVDERDRLEGFQAWASARPQLPHPKLGDLVTQSNSWGRIVHGLAGDHPIGTSEEILEKANALVFMEDFVERYGDEKGRVEFGRFRGKSRMMEAREARAKLEAAIRLWSGLQGRLDQAAKEGSEKDKYFAAFRSILEQDQ